MKPGPIRKVILQSTTFTVLIGFIIYMTGRFKSDWLYDYQWFLVAYFYIITMISLIVIELTARKKAENISKGFFGAMMVRLFVSIILALLIIYFDRENSTVFAVNFILLYLLYLGFEIYYLLTNLQPRINRGNDIEKS